VSRPEAVELRCLLPRLPASAHVRGETARLITDLAIDSRAVRAGALFVALRGTQSDGHRFIDQAIANGAIAIVVEEVRALNAPPYVTVIHVPDTRRALSALVAAFHGDPSHQLDVIGVTGTSGKTTTTNMLRSIFDQAGRACGLIGTVGASFGQRSWALANTTPLPPELQSLLAQMRDCGARAVALEVSSHALALGRVDDVRFAAAALTNVTRDHLDFHQTLEAYAAAKHRLFTMAQSAVLNTGDAHGARWHLEVAARVPTLTYSIHGDADMVPSRISVTAEGSSFTLDGRSFTLRLPGRFNVENALAAIGVARLQGIDDATSAAGLECLEQVPGRMERIRGGGIDVVIDYSHKPDALENALHALRETTHGKLAVVFGCGGDRDRGKRPHMGEVAARLADRIYLTSDNPRSEPPQAIADEIAAGIGTRAHVVELDRRAAIERAVRDAGEGDVVLVAGKGHETYQIVGDRVLPFDDAAVAREALARREALQRSSHP
jgi:UDP-N-acetylmuramoyl-L-alanyl-D-glutamate--2,6-diaminopimelate ligase